MGGGWGREGQVTKVLIGVWMLLLLLLFFCLFRAAPMAYGRSQVRGRIGTAAAGLHHSHSNAGSEPHLQPTPQHTATPDP